MKKHLSVKTLVCLLSINLTHSTYARNHKGQSHFEKQPSIITGFTENKGQVHDQNYLPRPDILFGAKDGELNVHIRNSGLSYQLEKIESFKNDDSPDKKHTGSGEKEALIPDKISAYRVDINWMNYNPNFKTLTGKALDGYSNYYLPTCPEGALHSKTYSDLIINNLYNGIDLHYYISDGNIKYDYVIKPGANYKSIQLQVSGAQIEKTSGGGILLVTPFGNIEDGAPLVFQNGKQLNARWIINGNTLSFEIDHYNPSKELIIDPLLRLWGTYFGGTAKDYAYNGQPDQNGNFYLTGYTSSNTGTIIATTGAHQTTFGGDEDAFLVKFNSQGKRMWATYLGGVGKDRGTSCLIDKSGRVYITGSTNSAVQPAIFATAGAYQTGHKGVYDAFIQKFDSTGVRIWGTLFGGTNADYSNYSCIDKNNNIYIVGETNSSSGLLNSPNAHQTTIGGGSLDGFFAKFDSSGSYLYSSYYGGTGTDRIIGCAVDTLNNLFISGVTLSNGNSIATSGSHQPFINGGYEDAFLAKFDSSGVRKWGTFYGDATGNETGYRCATDKQGNVFLTGATDLLNSTIGIISSPGAHQTNYGGGSYDCFLVKFNTLGVRQWGTFYGGTGAERAYSVVTDTTGNVYISGETSSNNANVISTAGNFPYGGGSFDAFAAKFQPNGQRIWGTYYGGSSYDGSNFCSLDKHNNLYIGCLTQSFNGIASSGVHQTNNMGNQDAFVVKLRECANNLFPQASSNSPVCVGSNLSLNGSSTNSLVTSYLWDGPLSYTSATANTSINNSSVNQSGTYTLTVYDAGGCYQSAQITVTVDLCTGITSQNPDKSIVKLYPNPVNDVLYIQLDGNAKRNFILYDMNGRLINAFYSENEVVHLNTENLKTGIFILKIEDESGKIISTKFKKE